MKIVTHYDPKPIPSRRFDWSAVDDDTYDVDCDENGYFSRCPIGYGSTEQEAIDDLMDQFAEEDLGSLDLEDEYGDGRQEYADAVCIPLDKPL